jgi:hypothetical protein
MKSAALFLLIVGFGAPCIADSVRLQGEPFKPSVPIKWAASDKLPNSLTIYKVIADKFSQSVSSNAMALGSLKTVNLINPPHEKGTIEFRDKREQGAANHVLRLSGHADWIEYNYNHMDEKPGVVHGVPTVDDAEALALKYFISLGGNTNELTPKPWQHSDTTLTQLNASMQPTNKVLSARCIYLSRQIGGIDVVGNYMWADFGNDAKLHSLHMKWTPLQSYRVQNTAGQDQLLEWLKDGKGVRPEVFQVEPAADITGAKSFTIKRAFPIYGKGSESDPPGLLRPFLELLIEADTGTNKADFLVDCPILADEVLK